MLIVFAPQNVTFGAIVDLTLALSSPRIQMAALGHTSTPFCFVVRQFPGFFPGQGHLSEVSLMTSIPSSSLVVLAFSCNLSVPGV